MNITDRELQLAKQIANKQARSWVNVEREDLTAYLYLWLVEKHKTVERYRYEEGGEGKLYVSLNRAATKYAAKEQSHHNGASVTRQQQTNYTYTFNNIDKALEYLWNYEHVILSTVEEHPQHGYTTQTINTDNDIQTLMIDIKTAYSKLNPAEQIMLEYRFREDKTFQQIGELLNISDNAARMRINRLITKLQRIIG